MMHRLNHINIFQIQIRNKTIAVLPGYLLKTICFPVTINVERMTAFDTDWTGEAIFTSLAKNMALTKPPFTKGLGKSRLIYCSRLLIEL